MTSTRLLIPYRSAAHIERVAMEQTANAEFQVSLRTAERNWTYAKAWLLQAIADEA